MKVDRDIVVRLAKMVVLATFDAALEEISSRLLVLDHFGDTVDLEIIAETSDRLEGMVGAVIGESITI